MQNASVLISESSPCSCLIGTRPCIFPKGRTRSGGRSGWAQASDSSSREGSALAWPTYHRLPDEVVHEVPSEQCHCHRRREGRVFHRDRLSDRSRSAVAVADERAAWTPPARP